MADKTKDADDELMTAWFASAPIADDGFSQQVVRRIRSGVRLRRWCLSSAIAIGSAIAFKPALTLLVLAQRYFLDSGFGLLAAATTRLPLPDTLVVGGALFALLLIGLRIIED